jgi:hypothetical protein
MIERKATGRQKKAKTLSLLFELATTLRPGWLGDFVLKLRNVGCLSLGGVGCGGGGRLRGFYSY